MDFDEKIKEMQKYVPHLQRLIENLKKDDTKESQLNKMQLLYNLLTKGHKGIKLDKLLKCEEVLIKVYGNCTSVSNCESPKSLQTDESNKNYQSAENSTNEKFETDILPKEKYEENSANELSLSNAINKNSSKDLVVNFDCKDENKDHVILPAQCHETRNINSNNNENFIVEETSNVNEEIKNIENNDQLPKEELNHSLNQKISAISETSQILGDIKLLTSAKTTLNEENNTEININNSENLEKEKTCIVKQKEHSSNDGFDTEKTKNNEILTKSSVTHKLTAISPVRKSLRIKSNMDKTEKAAKKNSSLSSCEWKKFNEKQRFIQRSTNNGIRKPEKRKVKNLKINKNVSNNKLKEVVINLDSDDDQSFPNSIINSNENRIFNEKIFNKIDSSNMEKIELEPLRPTDKPAVVYVVKNDKSKIETIDLLESDSDGDEDVILVNSSKPLKKQNLPIPVSYSIKENSKESCKLVQVSNKTPSAVLKTTSVPMFTISSVESINPLLNIKKKQNREGFSKSLITSSLSRFWPSTTIESRKHFNAYKNVQNNIPFKNYLNSKNMGRVTITPIKAQRSPVLLKTFNEITSKKLHKSFNLKSDDIKQHSANNMVSIKNLNKKEKCSFFGTNNSKQINTENILKTSHVESNLYTTSNQTSVNDTLAIEWLENFIKNLCDPNQIKTNYCSFMLHKVIDTQNFLKIKKIIDSHNEIATSTMTVPIVTNNGTSQFYTISEVNVNDSEKDILKSKYVDDQTKLSIRRLFFKDNRLTELGQRVCMYATVRTQHILTKERHTGQITSRTLKSNNRDDEEYEPHIKISVQDIIDTAVERRKSLRRESKQRCKELLSFKNDDEDDFLKYIESSQNEKFSKSSIANVLPKKPSNSKGTASKMKMKGHLRKTTSLHTLSVKKSKTVEDKPNDIEIMAMDQTEPTWMNGNKICDTTDLISSDDSNREFPNCETEIKEGTNDNTIDTSTNNIQNNQDENSKIPTKNTNRAHHCRSEFNEYCLFCQEKVQFVVSHYVNSHKDHENLIARLPKHDVNYLTRYINLAYLNQSKMTAYQYSGKCIFCKRNMNFALRYWFEHYTMHTGEYGYSCSKCLIRKPRKQQIRRHCDGECQIPNPEIVTDYDIIKKASQIDCFICKLCNYLQLHKKNLFSHLRTQHDVIEINGQHFRKLVLLKFMENETNETFYQDIDDCTQDTNISDNAATVCLLNDDCNNHMDIYSERQTDDALNLLNYMEFPDLVHNDSLSFTICNMLATNEPIVTQNNDANNDNTVNPYENVVCEYNTNLSLNENEQKPDITQLRLKMQEAFANAPIS